MDHVHAAQNAQAKHALGFFDPTRPVSPGRAGSMGWCALMQLTSRESQESTSRSGILHDDEIIRAIDFK